MRMSYMPPGTASVCGGKPVIAAAADVSFCPGKERNGSRFYWKRHRRARQLLFVTNRFPVGHYLWPAGHPGSCTSFLASTLPCGQGQDQGPASERRWTASDQRRRRNASNWLPLAGGIHSLRSLDQQPDLSSRWSARPPKRDAVHVAGTRLIERARTRSLPVSAETRGTAFVIWDVGLGAAANALAAIEALVARLSGGVARNVQILSFDRTLGGAGLRHRETPGRPGLYRAATRLNWRQSAAGRGIAWASPWRVRRRPARSLRGASFCQGDFPSRLSGAEKMPAPSRRGQFSLIRIRRRSTRKCGRSNCSPP